MKIRLIVIVAMLALILMSYACHAATFIDAIAQQESGNRPLPKYWDVNAYRLGYFSISEAVWKDATDFDKSLKSGTWKQCETDREYGAKIMMSYLRRYCPQAVKTNDYETMARVWNGGPNGAKVKATEKYWQNIKKLMANN